LNATPLVKSKAVVYRRAMLLKPSFTVAALLGCSASFAFADVVQLKDAAAVTGKILTEKADSLVVDVGYTVLQIPRGSIVSVSKTAADTVAPVTTAPAATGQFYAVTTKPGSVRDVSSLVKQIGEAVVQVKTPGGLGSGFFLNEDGYLITNFHVIEGETEISVEVYHQKNGQLDRVTYKKVKIIALNKFHDLALLRIEDADAPKFKSVSLGTADSLSVGEGVFAIGSPLGLERTVTQGIVSTKTRQMQGQLYLQTNTQINPGNSGGPLFNLAGEVVGVTNMKITFGEGLGFAIPSELVKSFLDHRDAFAYSTDNPNNPFRYLEPPSRTKGKATDGK
jgi:serine protease Do